MNKGTREGMSLEFLTSGNWIERQIDFLVYLQGLRAHLSPIFNNLFLSITSLGELPFGTMLICIIYWCIDFRAGIFLFTLNSLGMLFAQLAKSTACIYRPWVLSDRVKPLEAALPRAGGYSFPSGHSTMVSTSLGGIAYLMWKNKKWLSILLLFIIFAVVFSRMYVGVHTPQDVLFGILLSILFIILTNVILSWCEKEKNRYLYVLAVMDIVALGILYYILAKKYPLDYVNGKLLASPMKAKYIAVVYTGWVMGMLNGAYLSAKFFSFNPKDGSLTNKIIRAVIGCAILYVMLHYIQIYFFEGEQGYKITFACMLLAGFFITCIYPMIFSKFSSK